MLLNRIRAFSLLGALTLALSALAAAQTAVPVVVDPADAFFDDSVLHDIRLAINGKDWTSLKVNFLLNDYYPGDLRWNDQVVRGIGVRSRGLGSRSGTKPGMRVDFDFYSKSQKFLGLKSFIFRNQTQDASGLRERLSMLFFRRMGIVASREAHARLFVNNEYAGLYTIVEALDKTWLAKNLGEDGGYLYEYAFDVTEGAPVYRFTHLGSDPALYVPKPFKPQTHEDLARGDVVERFIWTVDQASDAVWRTAIAEFLDLPKFIRHLAIESFLAEEDGLTGDYGPNNFYFYNYLNKSLLTFLPWDKSNTFWEGPNYFIFRNVEDGPVERRNRLVLRAFQYPDLRNLYLDTLLECADSASSTAPETPGAPPFTQGWLEREVNREYEQIRAAALADTLTFTNEQFEAAIVDLKTFARERSAAVRAQVAAARQP